MKHYENRCQGIRLPTGTARCSLGCSELKAHCCVQQWMSAVHMQRDVANGSEKGYNTHVTSFPNIQGALAPPTAPHSPLHVDGILCSTLPPAVFLPAANVMAMLPELAQRKIQTKRREERFWQHLSSGT